MSEVCVKLLEIRDNNFKLNIVKLKKINTFATLKSETGTNRKLETDKGKEKNVFNG